LPLAKNDNGYFCNETPPGGFILAEVLMDNQRQKEQDRNLGNAPNRGQDQQNQPGHQGQFPNKEGQRQQQPDKEREQQPTKR